MTNLITTPSFMTETGKFIIFIPVKDIPGYSHRVVIDQRTIGFLSNDCRPSQKAAAFFLEKHQHKAA